MGLDRKKAILIVTAESTLQGLNIADQNFMIFQLKVYQWMGRVSIYYLRR